MGAFTLTPPAVKLLYESTTLWSSSDSPVLWHPGRLQILAVVRVLAGREALGRRPSLQGVSGLAHSQFWTGRAGQGWMPEQRLAPLPDGPLQMAQKIRGELQEAVEGLQEKPSPLALRASRAFRSLLFFAPFSFGWNLSSAWASPVLLLAKSPQICRKPYISVSWSFESFSLPWMLYDIWQGTGMGHILQAAGWSHANPVSG